MGKENKKRKGKAKKKKKIEFFISCSRVEIKRKENKECCVLELGRIKRKRGIFKYVHLITRVEYE